MGASAHSRSASSGVASADDVEAQLVPASERVDDDDDDDDDDARATKTTTPDDDDRPGALALPELHRVDVGPRGSERAKYYAVGLLTLTAMFLYADQNLLSPNMSAVAEDFDMTDKEKDLYLGGYLQLAFFVVGSPASFLIGWLADKPTIRGRANPRTRLFVLTIMIGEGPCLATYWVRRVRSRLVRALISFFTRRPPELGFNRVRLIAPPPGRV